MKSAEGVKWWQMEIHTMLTRPTLTDTVYYNYREVGDISGFMMCVYDEMETFGRILLLKGTE